MGCTLSAPAGGEAGKPLLNLCTTTGQRRRGRSVRRTDAPLPTTVRLPPGTRARARQKQRLTAHHIGPAKSITGTAKTSQAQQAPWRRAMVYAQPRSRRSPGAGASGALPRNALTSQPPHPTCRAGEPDSSASRAFKEALMAKPRIAIIIGSTRDTRFGDKPAEMDLREGVAARRHRRGAGRSARLAPALLQRWRRTPGCRPRTRWASAGRRSSPSSTASSS